MALDDLLARLEREAGTAGTSGVSPDVPVETSQTLGGTAGTCGTAQADKERSADAGASIWLLHFTDREPLEVHVAPKATRAEMLAIYPDAVSLSSLAISQGQSPWTVAAGDFEAKPQAAIGAVSKLRTNSQMISGKSGANQWVD